jgi:hypothetical protein
MSSAPAITAQREPNPAAADLRARAAFDQQLWMLGRLAQAGLNLAMAMEAQALAVQPNVATDQGPQPYGKPATPELSLDALPSNPADLALAFTRVSRAVRMTIALQSRLLKDDARSQVALKAPAPPLPETRLERTGRVGAIFRRLVAQTDLDLFEAAELVERAHERLADPDITGALLDRPVADLVAAICRDLGLSPDWSRTAGEAWARGENLHRSAHPGEGRDPAAREGLARITETAACRKAGAPNSDPPAPATGSRPSPG